MSDRMDRRERQRIVEAFEAKYKDDPNLNEVCMRYTVYDGDWLQVKVKDIWAADYPHIFNECNVFVEEAPAVRVPLPQD